MLIFFLCHFICRIPIINIVHLCLNPPIFHCLISLLVHIEALLPLPIPLVIHPPWFGLDIFFVRFVILCQVELGCPASCRCILPILIEIGPSQLLVGFGSFFPTRQHLLSLFFFLLHFFYEFLLLLHWFDMFSGSCLLSFQLHDSWFQLVLFLCCLFSLNDSFHHFSIGARCHSRYAILKMFMFHILISKSRSVGLTTHVRWTFVIELGWAFVTWCTHKLFRLLTLSYLSASRLHCLGSRWCLVFHSWLILLNKLYIF